MFRRPLRKKPRSASGSYRFGSPDAAHEARRDLLLRRAGILGAFAILLVATTPRLTPPIGDSLREVDFEAVPPEDIIADSGFTSEDIEATRKAREEAASAVPARYFVHRGRVEDAIERFQARVDLILSQAPALDTAIREALGESDSAQTAAAVVDAAVTRFAAELKANEELLRDMSSPESLAAWLTPSPRSVPERVFTGDPAKAGAKPLPVKELREPEEKPLRLVHADQLAQIGRAALEYTLAHGVIEPSVLAQDKEAPTGRSIVVQRDRLVGGLSEVSTLLFADMPAPSRARQEMLPERIRAAVEQAAGKAADVPLDWTRLSTAAGDLARLDIVPTLVLDEAATESARETARNQVQPVPRTIRRNDRIQEGNRAWDPQSIADYRAYIESKQRGNEPAASVWGAVVSHAILVGLVLSALVYCAPFLLRKPHMELRELTLTLGIVCATLVLGRLVLFVNPSSGLLVPVAAAVMLLTILTGARVAALAGLLTSALVSIQFGYDWRLLAVNWAMSTAVVLNIFAVRRRNDITNAAFKASLLGLLALTAAVLATGSLLEEPAFSQYRLLAINAAACFLIVPALLNPLERLSGVTTDIQLLEYSDLNNEVLSRLSIEVPATYAHSRMVGDLAETAAISIGANGLLAKVCAYYHDIGKLRRPEYFAENQTGVNVHDGMNPRMSARAIASHVSEGAEMAREVHLPKPVVDAIYEHHGTCLISFFYQQAMAQQKHGDVREEDFRYPGPKPQSRETAILMICDAVESGVRSIKNPNEERVRELIDKIVDARSRDRQFDECDLTLKELDTIKEVVTRRMLTSLHGRIAYPDKFPGKRPSNVIPISGGGPS